MTTNWDSKLKKHTWVERKDTDADGYKTYEVKKICTYCGNSVIKTSPHDHWCPKCGHDVII